MTDVYNKTFSLWKSLNNMALALSMSEVGLNKLHKSKQIPPEKYDNILISRAMFIGTPLTRSELKEYRDMDVSNEIKIKRQVIIQNLYDHFGGVDVFATKIDSSENALYLAKNRGKLPINKKFEIMTLAKDHGFDLPTHLFESIKAVKPSQMEDT